MDIIQNAALDQISEGYSVLGYLSYCERCNTINAITMLFVGEVNMFDIHLHTPEQASALLFFAAGIHWLEATRASISKGWLQDVNFIRAGQRRSG